MNRREMLFLTAGTMAAFPQAAAAQQASRMRRIGFLMGYPEGDAQSQPNVSAFKEGLAKVGLQEGRNIQIDYRWAGLDPERARTFAKELIGLKPDLIVASTNQVVSIAMQETSTVPIVFVFIGDPIGSRFAASIERPGRNLTGFANFEAPMGGKWLEILKEVSPRSKRVGFVHHPGAPPHVQFLQYAETRAASFGFELTSIPVRSVAEIERLISDFATAGSDSALVVAPHALTLGSRSLITKLASQHRLPGVYGDGHFAHGGGLLSFGISPPDQLRRAATYVDAILKGANPAELPVQLPTKYEMIINLKVANELGIAVPPTMLARADEVIE